jgi:UPF0148 protein
MVTGMAQKKEDEIMAEYLLKGGKMLEKTCRQCGCPLFEYRKKTFCVVCAEREQETNEKGARKNGDKASPLQAPAADRGEKGKHSDPHFVDTSTLEEELVATVHNLCTRIRAEVDPDRCQMLMDSVKTGIEAFTCLRQR